MLSFQRRKTDQPRPAPPRRIHGFLQRLFSLFRRAGTPPNDFLISSVAVSCKFIIRAIASIVLTSSRGSNGCQRILLGTKRASKFVTKTNLLISMADVNSLVSFHWKRSKAFIVCDALPESNCGIIRYSSTRRGIIEKHRARFHSGEFRKSTNKLYFVRF